MMKEKAKKMHLIILNMLRNEELHGYGIAERMEEIYGIKKPGSSVIYPLLARLKEEGLIDIAREEKRDKKIYGITGRGIKYLRSRKNELKEAEKMMRNAGKFYRMGGEELIDALHELMKNMEEIGEREMKEAENVIKEAALKIKLLLLRGEMNE